MSVPRALLAPALVAAIACLAPAPALAGPSHKEKAEARALVNDARKAMKDKRWADAVTAYKKADTLDPGAALEVDLAEAQIAAGRLADASRTLTAVISGSDASPAAKRARDAAAKRLVAIKSRIPMLRVTVKGPTGKVSVIVDGADVDASGEIPVNPGDHTVGASADGYNPAEKEAKVAEGAHETVELTLAPAPTTPPPPPETPIGPRVPGIVLSTVGGAALIVGGVFGGLAFSATSQAKSQCNGNVCPSSAADDIHRSKLFGNVSTGMLAAGGAVALTGIVLAIVAPGSKKADEAAKSAKVAPWVGADQVGVAGSF